MKLAKKITFVYQDSADYQNYFPIIKEAENRGYEVKVTQDPFEKCEIGMYCQHDNFPENSKFSVIMLHDIIQGYGRWPDIWANEPWNKYDFGILPGQTWKDLWEQSSKSYYTRPKHGVYEIGWPKADILNSLNKEQLKKDIFEKHQMDLNKKTILYAPAWENDHKQDDFVQSLKDLDVNLLIKHYPFDPKTSVAYKECYDEMQHMYELHKDIPNVTILDPKTNIMEVIAISDILVSEESSTMCEAVMLGIPAVSVSNWLIPDQNPKRFPETDYDFVLKTSKENLKSCIENILDNYDTYQKEAIDYSAKNFKNTGKTAIMIMDIIDEFRETGKSSFPTLSPLNKERLPFSRYVKVKDHDFRIRFVHKWSKQNLFIKKLLLIYRKVKS